MGRKEITTKEDLMKVIELFENTGITYWLNVFFHCYSVTF